MHYYWYLHRIACSFSKEWLQQIAVALSVQRSAFQQEVYNISAKSTFYCNTDDDVKHLSSENCIVLFETGTILKWQQSSLVSKSLRLAVCAN